MCCTYVTLPLNPQRYFSAASSCTIVLLNGKEMTCYRDTILAPSYTQTDRQLTRRPPLGPPPPPLPHLVKLPDRLITPFPTLIFTCNACN